ncbi:holin [Jeotgalibaca porci]|uniref:holin n=1 Tax=Jeotgalibaca porci TaxID=1868793 RepID=UPI0035A03FD5
MNELLNNILSAVAFVGVFSGIVVQVIKNAELVNKRYLPLVSVGLGMVVGYILAIGFYQDTATYIAAGFIGGAVASGVYDLATKTLGGK